MTDYGALIARIEAAGEPSRILDAAIATETLGRTVVISAVGDPRIELDAEGPFGKFTEGCPEWTSSLDAALALVRAMLPGWRIAFGEEDDRWLAAVFPPRNALGQFTATHANPALALLIAALRAKQQESDHD